MTVDSWFFCPGFCGVMDLDLLHLINICWMKLRHVLSAEAEADIRLVTLFPGPKLTVGCEPVRRQILSTLR